VKQKWLNADGDEVPWWDLDGIERHITEYSLANGDVSVVNFGANPYTDASLRAAIAVGLLDPQVARRAIEDSAAEPETADEVDDAEIRRVVAHNERMAQLLELRRAPITF
jgi:hypothetical protein